MPVLDRPPHESEMQWTRGTLRVAEWRGRGRSKQAFVIALQHESREFWVSRGLSGSALEDAVRPGMHATIGHAGRSNRALDLVVDGRAIYRLADQHESWRRSRRTCAIVAAVSAVAAVAGAAATTLYRRWPRVASGPTNEPAARHDARAAAG